MDLSKEPGELTLKRLVLVRQLYQQAVTYTRPRSNVVNRLMSSIVFDLATETMLKTAYRHLVPDPNKKPKDGFSQALNQVEHALSKKGLADRVPLRQQILRVHKIRNDAQHEARYPNETDIDECRLYVRDFLEEFCKLIWDLDLSSVSLVNSVQNETVKDWLAEAEKAFEEKDYQETVRCSNAGLTWALKQVRSRYVNEPYVLQDVTHAIDQRKTRARHDSWMGVGTLRELNPNLRDALQSVRRETLDDVRQILSDLEEMARAVEADVIRSQYAIVEFTTGINRADYLRFRQMAGHVDFTGNDPAQPVFSRMSEEIDRDDAEFVLEFSISSVVQIESQVGDIEKPFQN